MLINIANYMTVYLFKNAILNLFLLVSHLYIFKLYQKEREIKSIRFYFFFLLFLKYMHMCHVYESFHFLPNNETTDQKPCPL